MHIHITVPFTKRPSAKHKEALHELDHPPAVRADAAQILAYITELADYERARHQVVATLADIEHSLFEEGSTVHSLICERDGKAIGFAVYFYSYSTWQGRNGIYLEDLYITLNNVAAAQVGRCCGTSLAKPWPKVADASSGACWTGTSPRSALPIAGRRTASGVGALSVGGRQAVAVCPWLTLGQHVNPDARPHRQCRPAWATAGSRRTAAPCAVALRRCAHSPVSPAMPADG